MAYFVEECLASSEEGMFFINGLFGIKIRTKQ
jgi:hypothetical protein